MGMEPKSTMACIAFDERQPRRMYCATFGGEVFASQDGGQTWSTRSAASRCHTDLCPGMQLRPRRVDNAP